MGDIAAVVRGLRAGGATEIMVLDGHGTQAFVPRLMEPGAKYITGTPRPAVALGPGQDVAGHGHGRLPRDDGHARRRALPHAVVEVREPLLVQRRGIGRDWPSVAILAGHYGVPPILVTGDEAACRETQKFFGEQCVTVAVKRDWLAKSAVLYPFAETRQALYEGAKRAVAAMPKCKPYRWSCPSRPRSNGFRSTVPPGKPRLVTKEGTITETLRLFEF